MANRTLHPALGTRGELNALRFQQIPSQWTPETVWRCELLAADVGGAASTQISTVTIPAAGFASGRLTLTFTGGGLVAPVPVVADALEADTNLTLAVTLEAAIATARAGALLGVVDSEMVASEVVTVNYVEGIGVVEVAVLFVPSQVSTLTWSGVDLENGDYVKTFTGGGLGAPEVVTTSRMGGVPGTNTQLAAQGEIEIENKAGLSAIVQSADAAGAVNTVLMFPGIAAVAIAITVPQFAQRWDSQFGGTETDGNYVHTFIHPSLPMGSVAVPTPRVGAVPATNILLSAQAENDIESTIPIALLVATADTDGVDLNEIRTFPGVTGLVVTTSAPAPGTLVVNDVTDGPSLVVADATPAGPVVTVAHTIGIDLNSLQPDDAFPANMMRGSSVILVVEAYPGSATATLDDGGAASTDVLAAVPITTPGWAVNAGTLYGSQKTEGAWSPRLELDLGANPSPATGELVVQVEMSPLPE